MKWQSIEVHGLTRCEQLFIWLLSQLLVLIKIFPSVDLHVNMLENPSHKKQSSSAQKGENTA